ncbi:MAG: hypothetical protein IPH84_03445 [Bacteroidales bacterium]|nr:hypothetical protein [Bacteroidales bacterium]
MDHSKLFETPFADIYPYYTQKAEKKGHEHDPEGVLMPRMHELARMT